jgi:hypothetical protein
VLTLAIYNTNQVGHKIRIGMRTTTTSTRLVVHQLTIPVMELPRELSFIFLLVLCKDFIIIFVM